MRNIELKARCADLEALKERAERLGARDAGVLEQRDTFFHAPDARLKLREFGDGRAELIGYRRPDTPEACGSDYGIHPTEEPASLLAVLAVGLGVVGIVRKRRRLLLYRSTRIHLDDVVGLGSFVELETVLTDQSDAEGRRELEWVAEALGLRHEDCVAEAYIDLILRDG